MINELRLSARRLLKSPSFSVLALLCIALGIGANVAVFSVLSAVLVRPLPFADADRLAMIFDTHPGPGPDEDYEVSPPNYAAWQAKQTPFTEIAAGQPRTYSFIVDADGEGIREHGRSFRKPVLHWPRCSAGKDARRPHHSFRSINDTQDPAAPSTG